MRAAPLRLHIAASPQLAGILALAHVAAIVCAILFLPVWWMRAPACVAIVVSLVFHVRRDALQRTGDAVTEIHLRDGGYCELTLLNEDILAGNIEGTTFVAPLLMVVNVRLDDRAGRRSVILMPDSAPSQELRQARVWLRHRARPDDPASRPL